MNDTESPIGIGRWANRVIDLVVGTKVIGIRLDQYLASQFSEFSRSVIQKVIDGGE